MRGRFTRRRWLAAGAALIIIGGACTFLLAAFNRFTIEGAVRPTLTLRAADGIPFRLVPSYGRRHAMLFFLVSCPHCKITLEHWRRLRPSIDGCDLFSVSLSEPAATSMFAAAKGFPFPVWGMDAKEASVQLGVRRVPSLLLVDERGVVDRVRTGARSFDEDSLLLVRYCDGGSLGLSAVDSLGEDGSP